MTKKLIYLIAGAAVLIFVSGCANGPIRNFFRGGPCNTCQPPVGQPYGCGTNTAPSCDSGVCGTGVSTPNQTSFFGRPLFQGTQNANDVYYSETSQQALPAPGTELNPYGGIPESSSIYDSNISAPASPMIGPLEGSGTR